MVPIRSHLRRLKSGKVIHVRSHMRRTSTPTSISGSGADSSGMIWILLAVLIGVGLLTGGVATVASSSPVAFETTKTSHPEVATPSNSEEKLAEMLRAARKGIGLSQGEVSVRTGIAQSTINDFERAQAAPTAGTLKVLSSVYQLSLDEWSVLEITRSEIR